MMQLHEGIGIVLMGGILIILPVISIRSSPFTPDDISEMQSFVVEDTTPGCPFCFFTGYAIVAQVHACKMVVQPSLRYQVSEFNERVAPGNGRGSIVRQILIFFQLFEVAHSPCVVHGDIERVVIVESKCIMPLHMCLSIIVCLVFVGVRVESPVGFERVFRNATPGLIGFFLTGNDVYNGGIVFTIPSGSDKVAG